MKRSHFATIALLAAALMAAGCANTIRGVGKDTANAVSATEQAGSDVARAVK